MQAALGPTEDDGVPATQGDGWRGVLRTRQSFGIVGVQPQDSFGPRPCEGDDRSIRRYVYDFQVLHDGVLVQPLHNGFLLSRAGEQIDAVAGMDHGEQVDDAAPIAGEHGGSPVAWLQVVDPVGGQPVEQVKSVFTGGPEATKSCVRAQPQGCGRVAGDEWFGGGRLRRGHLASRRALALGSNVQAPPSTLEGGAWPLTVCGDAVITGSGR